MVCAPRPASGGRLEIAPWSLAPDGSSIWRGRSSLADYQRTRAAAVIRDDLGPAQTIRSGFADERFRRSLAAQRARAMRVHVIAGI